MLKKIAIFSLTALFLSAASSPLLLARHHPQFAQSPLEEHAITLYYFPSCPYCQKVENYLHSIHKKVPMKNTRTDPKAAEELKKIGGYATVPCLIVDGKAIYGSDTIIQWLKDHQDWLQSESNS